MLVVGSENFTYNIDALAENNTSAQDATDGKLIVVVPKKNRVFLQVDL